MLSEAVRYIRARIEYYKRELRFGSLLSRSLISSNAEESNRIAYSSMLQYISVLEDALCVLEKKLDEYHKIRRIEIALACLPKALHNLLIFALQRKYHPVKYFAYRSFPSYSFSEVHPTYFSEIMALEKINLYIFNTLHPLMDLNIDHRSLYPPILCLSDRPRYAFEPLLEEQASPVCLPNPDSALQEPKNSVADLKNILISFMSLSHIYFPRTAPSHVRYSGAMGHEHMHRLLLLADRCLGYNEKGRIAGISPEIVNQKATEIFGNSLVDFSAKYYELSTSFLDKLLDACGNDQSLDSIQTEYVKKMLVFQFNEFLCDVGGIYLCGKSAYYSYANAFLNTDVRKKETIFSLINKKHPPRDLRNYILLKSLRYCLRRKFNNEIDEKKLADEFSDYEQTILNRKKNVYYNAIVEWQQENISRFRSLIFLFLNYCPKLQNDDQVPEREIIEKVKNNWENCSEYTPIQLINAMWYKTIFLREFGPFEVRWRLAIEHSRAK